MDSAASTRTPQPAEPVAVVGMACRLPGSPSPSAFWRLLRQGGDAITTMPADRRRTAATADDGATTDDAASAGQGRPRTAWSGGFLDRVDTFDAGFFGIPPREAATMDPQQRLMLELAWEVFEDAGIRPAAMEGSATGVFVGAIWDEYATLLRGHTTGARPRHAMTGVHRSIIANRVSYGYGLRGPSITVDTAQSSALVAVHTACESLRRQECTLALAGGVNLILTEDSMEAAAAQFGGLSPDGRCHTFDARANGFVRGEGGGVVLLKPLDAALRDGDDIHCVIRSGAVNNDGSTDGLTAPSPRAQEEVIRAAHRRAGVSPADVQYVELHGTGTPVGDPVEATALGAAFGGARTDGTALRVGSAKTNIGHLEGAAGIVGLLKTALAIRHRQLPPSLHYVTPHPRIPLADLGLRVQDTLTDWPRPDRPLLAGVSSFGMGGTNCHLVLAEAPAEAPAAPAVASAPALAEPSGAAPGTTGHHPAAAAGPVPWVLSAKSPAALRAQAVRLREHLAGDDHPHATPQDIGHALVTTRTAFAHRAVVLGDEDDADALSRGLDALAQDTETAGVIRGRVADGGLAVLFSGQGSQRAAMGRELYTAHPVFATALDDTCAHLDPHLDLPLREVMFDRDTTALDRTAYTQPALFAIEVALYRLAESWGLRPDCLMGHSVGELAAAHVAGVLSLPDACALVAARGRLMQSVTASGAMAAWQATEEEATEALAGAADRLTIAAVNGPSSVVVSGDRDAVHRATEAWRDRGRKAHRLNVSHAFHSPHMDAVLDELREVAAGLTFAAPAIPVVSNVTGRIATAEQLASPDYWARHAREAVRFLDGVHTLRDTGATTFVELGPDGLLAAMTRECLADHPGTAPGQPRPAALAVLRRDRSEPRTFATTLAQAYVRGAEVRWERAFAERPGRHVVLPTYAFQRERHWPDSTGGAAPDLAPAAGVNAARPGPGPAPARTADLLDTVRTQVAAVLGHPDPRAVDPGLTFKELGFDSLAATELGERLADATGLPLTATLTFDHPTPLAVAAHLREATAPAAPSTASALLPSTAHPDDDPLAVIAMSCRYPGGADTPEALWRLVSEGADAIGEFPRDRGWDLAALFDPDPDRPGTSYAHEGGFLYDAARFDAEFFGISPREALAADPQQRLLLETAWEAFERAGLCATDLKASPTGVFVGVMPQDYGPRLHEAPKGLDGHLLTGGTPSVVSGRVAFTFGLEGPAVSVDTACSSSLVALHLAAQSLRRGDCSLALAGGVTVMAAPGMFTGFSRQRGLAPDGRCKPFAAAADGTGWAEGAGLVLLERLSDARRHGHPVLALIRGSAINQDGASNGLTAPNGPSQQRVIRAALASAGLEPSEVDAVEAHGTGTTLGDPIEAQALLATYGRDRPGDRPLWLGSLKSNIGHTQAAAGVAGVIKMVMALRHGTLPASLHIDAPSPHVAWDSGAVRLLTESVGWPDTERARRAAVSSFGISGTNAHVIVEQAPEPARPDAATAPEPALPGTATVPEPARPDGATAPVPVRAPHGAVPWVLSARSAKALRGQARALAGQLAATPGMSPADIGWSLIGTRSVFEHRAVLVAEDRDTLSAALEALAGEENHPAVVGPGAVHPGAGADTGAGPVLVFPGQGSQWQGMGAALLDGSPVFAERLAECERALSPYVDWSLTDVLRGCEGAADLGRVDVVQPVLWAAMVSLAAVWAAHGVRPAAVVGHSQGEIAAAVVAGALSLDDAARVVALRSRALRRLAGDGAMASLGLSRERAAELMLRLGDRADAVVVAAVNGPESLVVSGPPGQVAAVVEECQKDGERARLIEVDYASHSPQVDRITGELSALLAGIEPLFAGADEVAFYSTVTGGRIGGEALDTGYWVRNLRDQVRFADTVEALLAAGHRVFIEASTHPVLTMGMRETFEQTGTDAAAVPTLRRDHGDPVQLIRSVAQAFTAGATVDWTAAFPAGPPPRTVDLPTYAFQRERYWLDTTGGRGGDPAGLGLTAVGHPQLGAAVRLADGSGHVLTGRLSAQTHPWLSDHTVAGVTLVPGAALVEWVLRAADEVGCGELAELTLRRPMVWPATGGLRIQVVVGPGGDDGRHDVAVYGCPEDAAHAGAPDTEWTCHAVGLLGPAVPEDPEAQPAGAWPPPDATPLDTDGCYRRLAAAGYGYGPAFQGLRALWRSGHDLFAEVELPEPAGKPEEFGIHPALLDAVLHPLLLDTDEAHGEQVWLPFAYGGVSLWAAGATTVRVRLTAPPPGPDGGRELRVVVADAVGAPVLTVDALVIRPAGPGLLEATAPHTTSPRPAVTADGGPTVRRRTAAATGARTVDWAARLAELSAADRYRQILQLVRDHAATVLGHTDAATVHPDASFKELGFESLTAVELRDRLAAATALRLPAALIFRHPTPAGVAHHLVGRLAPGDPGSATSPAPVTVPARSSPSHHRSEAGPSAAERLESASADQVLDFIDNELGVS
ncbi:type I polyketide synthase [Streptomyces cucumeris]|uniref:type I polyketide synthase n=1 Tax=Streptomyces cucumeris TaxID=2962890 RepID=UPI003D76584E